MCKFKLKVLVSGCLVGLCVVGMLLPSNTKTIFASNKLEFDNNSYDVVLDKTEFDLSKTNLFLTKLRLSDIIAWRKTWKKSTIFDRKKFSEESEPTAKPMVERPVKPTLEPSVEQTAEPKAEAMVKPSPKSSVKSPLEPSLEPSAEATTKPGQASTREWDIQHFGYATYTGSGYSGGCALLDPVPSDMEITALNPTDYNSYGVKAALAGAYLEVEGEKGTTTVYVTDLYPEGAVSALDLCPTSFGKIGDISAGKIDVEWNIVKAPITGNVSYCFKEGSNPWWAAIQVRDHKYPVLKMEWYDNGSWIDMEKTEWNHFIGTDMGTGSIKIRMTDINGEVVSDIIEPIPEDGVSSAYIVEGKVQFPD